VSFELFWKGYKNKIKKRGKKEIQLFEEIEKRLGEWALEELKKELAFPINIINWDIFEINHKMSMLDNLCRKRKILYEIASACLGRKNVLRRLLSD